MDPNIQWLHLCTSYQQPQSNQLRRFDASCTSHHLDPLSINDELINKLLLVQAQVLLHVPEDAEDLLDVYYIQ